MIQTGQKKSLSGLYIHQELQLIQNDKILSELQYGFQSSFRCLIGRSGLHSIAYYIYFSAKSADIDGISQQSIEAQRLYSGRKLRRNCHRGGYEADRNYSWRGPVSGREGLSLWSSGPGQ